MRLGEKENNAEQSKTKEFLVDCSRSFLLLYQIALEALRLGSHKCDV